MKTNFDLRGLVAQSVESPAPRFSWPPCRMYMTPPRSKDAPPEPKRLSPAAAKRWELIEKIFAGIMLAPFLLLFAVLFIWGFLWMLKTLTIAAASSPLATALLVVWCLWDWGKKTPEPPK